MASSMRDGAGASAAEVGGAAPCAFRLNRSLTLDPTGIAAVAERRAEAVCLAPSASAACGTAAAAACGGTTSPSPFCSVTKEVVTAFQAAQRERGQARPEPPGSPGSAFRHQVTIIETSSSEAPEPPAAVLPAAACPHAGASGVPGSAAYLSTALSSPAPPAQVGALPPAATAPALPRAPSVCLGALGSCPAHGVKAVCGKRNKMEDMYAVQPNFFDIPLSPTSDDAQINKLPQRIAVQLEVGADGSPASSLPLSPAGTVGGPAADPDPSANSYTSGSDASAGSTSALDTLHFFGVYDGHGGCQAAEHCARRLHHHLSHALAAACGCLVTDGNQLLMAADAEQGQVDWSITSSLMQSVANFACLALSGKADASSMLQHAGAAAASGTPPQRSPLCKVSVDSTSSSSSQGADDAPLCPLREGDVALCDNDSSGTASDRSSDCINVSALLEDALKDAFLRTDAEFANDGCAAMVGSTALVALVGTRKIWLANCGDSRAVLCRNGKAVQLTDDHKPEREDEAERVEKAGGQVLFWNGHRVMGVLAMSRAIGDHGLRPYIIPEPEVTVLCRAEEDDFLLLASDGLWDVMTNQDAVDLTNRCIKRAKEKGASRSAAVRIAASVLTKAAIDRGSKDNVTVVIIDLKQAAPEGVAVGGPSTASRAEPGAADDDAPCARAALTSQVHLAARIISHAQHAASPCQPEPCAD